MNNYTFDNIEIKAMATVVPDDCEQLMDYAPLFPDGEIEKFCKTTNVFQRFVGHRKKIIASDLCVAAANRIFEKFPELKTETDAIIFMSQSFDYEAPATSGIIQMRLGLEQCGAVYDVTYGCAAFPFGMQMAGSFILGGCRNVLLLIGDSVTTADISDKDAFLFGDSGCAIVVGPKSPENVLYLRSVQIRLDTFGSKYKALMCPFGKNRHRYSDMVQCVGVENANKLLRRYMDGSDVFTFSIKDAPAATKKFYEDFGCSPEDFDFAALHQANRMIIDNVGKRIKFPKEKVHITVDRYGNTSGVSIPLTICDYFEQHPNSGVKNILTLGFGVGMSVGICACSMDSQVCLPITRLNETYDDGLDYMKYLQMEAR